MNGIFTGVRLFRPSTKSAVTIETLPMIYDDLMELVNREFEGWIILALRHLVK